jgi:hypothetical protein
VPGVRPRLAYVPDLFQEISGVQKAPTRSSMPMPMPGVLLKKFKSKKYVVNWVDPVEFQTKLEDVNISPTQLLRSVPELKPKNVFMGPIVASPMMSDSGGGLVSTPTPPQPEEWLGGINREVFKVPDDSIRTEPPTSWKENMTDAEALPALNPRKTVEPTPIRVANPKICLLTMT